MKRKTLKNGTLVFSVDYDLECEDFELTDVNDEDLTEDVDFKHVTNYVHSLSEKIKEFYPSQHRTEGTIHLCDDYMLMKYRSFNSPDDDNFKDIDLGVVDIIPFVYTTY
jgi:uncharacterized protein YkuJ